MSSAKSILLAACIMLFAIFLNLLSFLGGYRFRDMQQQPAAPPDTVWIHDAANLSDEKPIGSITAKLPAAKPKKPAARPVTPAATPDSVGTPAADPDSVGTPAADPDSTLATPEKQDSATVTIPIVQRTYEGEHYKAVVQGYNPELVGIDIHFPEISAPKQKRIGWGISFGLQMGYGLTPSGWGPYAGAGGTIGIYLYF